MRAWEKLILKDGRDSLVEFIKKNSPQGSKHNKVVIVFDSKIDLLNSSAKDAKIEIIFTKNQSADDKIKNLVRLSKNPKEIVVVTNDKDIKFFVRSYSAKVIAINEFIKKDTAKNTQNTSTAQKSGLTYTQIDKINQELKEIWLKK